MNKFDIAQGVRVYYNNRKEAANTVFTSDGKYHHYTDGDMLRELISDEAFYLMSEKVMIAIDTLPEGNRQISVESITDAFKWIYGMLDSDELPLAREIVRSMLSGKINCLAEEMSLDH